MKTSQDGIDLIKKFEGCRLSAYKPVATEKYYTIGYGHYGPDVKDGQMITHAQAEAYLRADLEKFENAVNGTGRTWTQPEFDALVSFSYNCGTGNLRNLVKDRAKSQIADAFLLYNKAGGRTLEGLTRRRKAERDLFLKGTAEMKKPATLPDLKYGDKGQAVKYLQEQLIKRGYSVGLYGADGDYGTGTLKGLLDFIRDQKCLTVTKEIWDKI